VTDILLRSLLVGLVAAAIVGPLGAALGYVMARRRVPLKPLIDAVVALPLVLPPVAVGVLLIWLLGRQSMVGRALADLGISFIGTLPGVVLCASVMGAPLMIRSAESAFAMIPRETEEAARSLGASRLRTVLSISTPLAWRGLISGVVLVFARALGEFGATMVLVGYRPGVTDTLSLGIYFSYYEGRGAGMLTSLMVASILLCLVATIAARVLERGVPLFPLHLLGPKTSPGARKTG